MTIMLRRSSLVTLLFSACLQILCLVQALSKQGRETGSTGVPKPFVFSLQQSCQDWVIFAWNVSSEGFPLPLRPPRFTSCEITYMDQRSQVAKLVMVTVQPEEKTIRLGTLNRGTRYAASMTCNETLTSNTIHFVTGYPCSEAEMKEHADKLRRQSQKDKEISQRPINVTAVADNYSIMDMALGVFFAFFGSLIVGVFAYYIWRKHRHHRRIQRIFGQSHSEPFLTLHTPSDQPTSSF